MRVSTTVLAAAIGAMMLAPSAGAQPRPVDLYAPPRPPMDLRPQTGMARPLPPVSAVESRPLPPLPAPAAQGPPATVMTTEDDADDATPYETPDALRRQEVVYEGREVPGTIIVDPAKTQLYLVTAPGKAMRYGIGVGREGFTWTGREKVTRMAEWPDWHPPAEMIVRQPYLPRVMAGGPGNPLGARALYLGDTLYRIHGTNDPKTIGKYVSSGCVRLTNEDIQDLYGRVKVGAQVVVMPATGAATVPAADAALKPPANVAGVTAAAVGIPAAAAASGAAFQGVEFKETIPVPRKRPVPKPKAVAVSLTVPAAAAGEAPAAVPPAVRPAPAPKPAKQAKPVAKRPLALPPTGITMKPPAKEEVRKDEPKREPAKAETKSEIKADAKVEAKTEAKVEPAKGASVADARAARRKKAD